MLLSGRQVTPLVVSLEANLDAVSCVLLLDLVRALLRLPRTVRFWRACWGVGLCALPFCLAASLQMYAVPPPAVLREAAWWLYHAGAALPQFALPFACAGYAFRRRAVDPLLLALPLLLEGGLLLTVVEATDPRSRELLGFERTAALMARSARGIARKAKRFGQTDDITVIAVERLTHG